MAIYSDILAFLSILPQQEELISYNFCLYTTQSGQSPNAYSHTNHADTNNSTRRRGTFKSVTKLEKHMQPNSWFGFNQVIYEPAHRSQKPSSLNLMQGSLVPTNHRKETPLFKGTVTSPLSPRKSLPASCTPCFH